MNNQNLYYLIKEITIIQEKSSSSESSSSEVIQYDRINESENKGEVEKDKADEHTQSLGIKRKKLQHYKKL